MIGQTRTATAKILAFPSGGRKGLMKSASEALPNDNRPAPPIIDIDGWYHEAAMAEEISDKPHN